MKEKRGGKKEGGEKNPTVYTDWSIRRRQFSQSQRLIWEETIREKKGVCTKGGMV